MAGFPLLSAPILSPSHSSPALFPVSVSKHVSSAVYTQQVSVDEMELEVNVTAIGSVWGTWKAKVGSWIPSSYLLDIGLPVRQGSPLKDFTGS